MSMEHKVAVGTIPDDINAQNLTNLLDLLDHSQKTFGDKPAYTHMGQTISFADLEEKSNAFAAHLQNNTNLESGDRIAIQLPNVIQYPIALYGAMKAGLVVVNTNPLYTAKEMKHQFNDAGVKAIVIYQSMASKLEAIIDDTQIEHIFLSELTDFHPTIKRIVTQFVIKFVKKMEPAFSLPKAQSFRQVVNENVGKKYQKATFKPEDLAVLQYTGGTTGVAKGAMLSHANLVSNILQGMYKIDRIDGPWYETAMAPLPLYHIYAFTLTQAIMYQGGHNVLIPNPRDIPGFIKELQNWQITCFMGLNTLFVALCKQEDFKKTDFSKLAFTVSGGMALTKYAADLWTDTTGCMITEGYGLTETSPIIAINDPLDQQLGTVGQPTPHTSFRIIADDGTEAKPGEPGEISVVGPQVMVGYWQRDDSTKRTFTEDGYFKTGDIGCILENGCLKIVDRAKNMINVSGFNVYPNQLEDIISNHSDIDECAAIGVPDEKTGEAIKLFVVRNKDSLTEKKLIEWCREELTGYKIPKQIEFIDELPKSNVGKILHRVLRDKEMEKHNA